MKIIGSSRKNIYEKENIPYKGYFLKIIIKRHLSVLFILVIQITL